MAAPSLDALAAQYAGAGVGAILIYTNEAHPGEYYPHLTSMEQKLHNARLLRDLDGVARPILVDALDGACHRAYGGMPSMSWIFDQSGVPVYKAEWTDPASIGSALAYFVEVAARREAGQPFRPFRVERWDYLPDNRAEFYRRLERNGPKAAPEFRAFMAQLMR